MKIKLSIFLAISLHALVFILIERFIVVYKSVYKEGHLGTLSPKRIIKINNMAMHLRLKKKPNIKNIKVITNNKKQMQPSQQPEEKFESRRYTSRRGSSKCGFVLPQYPPAASHRDPAQAHFYCVLTLPEWLCLFSGKALVNTRHMQNK